MLIECDIPRHALLIVSGTPRRSTEPTIVRAFPGVEAALDESGAVPSLIGIHFMRHVFYLPFLNTGNDSSVRNYVNLRFHEDDCTYYCDLSFEPKGRQVASDVGLDLVLRPPPSGEWEKNWRMGFSALADRPVLEGFRVRKSLLRAETDDSRLEIFFAADNLKDVSLRSWFR